MTCVRARLVTLMIVVLACSLGAACAKPKPPRVLRDIPPFALTSQSGEAFGSEQLAGAPYLVSFFFTSCSTVCPPIMAEVKAIHDAVTARNNPTRVVSITVDPDNDTPERLTTYAKKLGVQAPSWTFLTGDHALVKEVVVDRLMTHMGEEEQGPGGLVDIGHGSHVLIIDAKGRLRGVHEPVETTRNGLIETLDLLAAETP